MMIKEGSTKIVNFMTPGAGVLVLGCGHISPIVKMHYSFKNLLFSKEGSTQFVNFMTSGAGVLVLNRGHISHYGEYVLSPTL